MHLSRTESSDHQDATGSEYAVTFTEVAPGKLTVPNTLNEEVLANFYVTAVIKAYSSPDTVNFGNPGEFW